MLKKAELLPGTLASHDAQVCIVIGTRETRTGIFGDEEWTLTCAGWRRSSKLRFVEAFPDRLFDA